MNEPKFEFDWNEEVTIASNAPAKFNPAKVGFIVEMSFLESQEHAAATKMPIGSALYRVEFLDGSIVEMPGEFIRHR